jgi:hypothetical protein
MAENLTTMNEFHLYLWIMLKWIDIMHHGWIKDGHVWTSSMNSEINNKVIDFELLYEHCNFVNFSFLIYGLCMSYEVMNGHCGDMDTT